MLTLTVVTSENLKAIQVKLQSRGHILVFSPGYDPMAKTPVLSGNLDIYILGAPELEPQSFSCKENEKNRLIFLRRIRPTTPSHEDYVRAMNDYHNPRLSKAQPATAEDTSKKLTIGNYFTLEVCPLLSSDATTSTSSDLVLYTTSNVIDEEALTAGIDWFASNWNSKPPFDSNNYLFDAEDVSAMVKFIADDVRNK